MDRLKTIESFVKVARARSFSLAAEELGTSRGLISKHVSALERRLGARLLNRSTREVSLTEIGERYFEFCYRMINDLDATESDVAILQAEPIGDLKVLVPKSFGGMHFTDAVAQFALEHPRIRVSIILDDQPNDAFDFAAGEVDVAIRVTPLKANSAMVARKLGSLRWLACAAPSYLARHGRPVRPMDLVHHRCLVHLKLAPDRIWRFANRRGVKVEAAFLSNSDLVIKRFAVAGVGIAQLPEHYIGAELKEGQLVPILGAYPLPERPLLALVPEGKRTPRKVRLLMDHLSRWYRAAGRYGHHG